VAQRHRSGARRKGEVDAGLAELRELAEAQPQDARRWWVLGSEARLEGQLELGRSALAHALLAARDAAPELGAVIHYERFLLLRDLGRVEEAVAAWEQAVKLDTRYQDSISQAYAMLTDAGRYSDALAYVARDENPLRAGLQRGLIAQQTGQMIEARKEWKAVAVLDPEQYAGGQEAWAEAVVRLGDPQPLLDRLQVLMTKHGTTRLLVLAGIAQAMNGQVDRAAMLFQQAIQLVRYGRPARQKLDRADWRLLSSVVKDEKAKEALKAYFVVIETLWG
jgi:tetratricopeptide (TPR) repeat protein